LHSSWRSQDSWLYGIATPGSGGFVPEVITRSPPAIGSDHFKLGVKNALGGTFAVMGIGEDRLEPPLWFGPIPFQLSVSPWPRLHGHVLRGFGPGAHSTGKNAGILLTWSHQRATMYLALETARFLADPPQGFATVPLLDRRGVVLLIDDPAPPLFEEWRVQKSAALLELRDRAQLQKLSPDYAGPAQHGWWVRDEGCIDTAALVEGFARGAREGGVEIRTGARVTGFLVEHDAVRGVCLEGGEKIGARQVAVAAGGWAGKLGRRAGSRVAMRPTRRHLLVTEPDPTVDPRGPILWSEPDAFYARPESGGLLVSACDETEVDPDRCSTDEAVRELVAAKTTLLLPRFSQAGAASFWAGLRTFAHDHDFLIGPDPGVSGLFWVAALGGHGMSTSVGVGRLAADLLLERGPVDPVASLVSAAR
jgi:glycine/D-amino acid oxidase-like deaminating enzyme